MADDNRPACAFCGKRLKANRSSEWREPTAEELAYGLELEERMAPEIEALRGREDLNHTQTQRAIKRRKAEAQRLFARRFPDTTWYGRSQQVNVQKLDGTFGAIEGFCTNNHAALFGVAFFRAGYRLKKEGVPRG
jgi:hypothetical protein